MNIQTKVNTGYTNINVILHDANLSSKIAPKPEVNYF
jgi:hypothetical protein